jgi:hypothetical protein
MHHHNGNNIPEELVCTEDKKFGVRIGHTIASSLAGFIAGFLVATIGWGAIIYMLRPFCK